MAVISIWDADIGKAIGFLITSGASALNLSGANITMQLDNGRSYAVSIVSAHDGKVEYTVCAGDFTVNRNLIGQLRVSFGTTRYHTSTFDIVVRRSIGRDPT